MENPGEILELLKFIETNFDVSKFEYKGMNFWPVIRNEIRLNLNLSINKNNNWDLKRRDKTLTVRLKSVYRNVKCFYYKRKFIRSIKPLNSEIQILTYPVSLFVDEVEGKKYCRYIDPYFEVIKKKYSDINYLAFLNKGDKKLDTHNPVTYLDLSDFNAYFELKYFLMEFDHKVSKEIDKLKLIFNEVNSLIYDNYSIKPVYYETIKNIIYINELSSYCDNLFRASKIKYVFIEDYYMYIHMAMCLAAKKNNIKVIEIQHGTLDVKYFPYSNKIKHNLLPDFVWCWSKSDEDLIKHYNNDFNYLVPFVGGNMWLRKFRNHEMKLVGDNEMKFISGIKENYSKLILISLQSTFLLTDTMIETIKLASSECFFLVRFHPLNTTKQQKDEIRNKLAGFKNVEIDFASSINIYYLFENCDVQITHSSATAIEALVFDLPTVICSKMGFEFYENQIKDGAVFYFDNAADIASFVSLDISINKEKIEKYLINYDLDITFNNLSAVLN